MENLEGSLTAGFAARHYPPLSKNGRKKKLAPHVKIKMALSP